MNMQKIQQVTVSNNNESCIYIKQDSDVKTYKFI